MTAIWNRINTLLLLLVLFALIGVVAMLATDARGGPLDPPGPPASTLPQVEPRSPIPPVGWNGTFPIVISQPGSYFLTRSLTGVANTDGIRLTYGDISLDLNGFTLSGANQTGNGIVVIGVFSNIRISNGVVREWLTGINLWDTTRGEAIYSRVDHITALYNSAQGISLGFDSEIIDCNASSNYIGIYTHYSVVRGCHVTDNSSIGIYVEDVSLVEDNKVWNNLKGIVAGNGPGQVGNNTVRSNTSTNNTTVDIDFPISFGNVSDSNVATCPGWVDATGVQTYNQMYQRDPC